MNDADGMPVRQFNLRLALTLSVFLASAMTAAVPALAQQKTGPGITGDDSLTWHGITLYGVIDIGVQYDTHSAPFTPYRPSASGNIVRQNSRQSVIGLTPSNMGQSRVGLQGIEPLNEEWSAVFQVETFFNPQSGEIADSLKSLAVNNGRSPDHSERGCRRQLGGAGLPDRLGRPQIGAIRHPHLRSSSDAAVGRHHQVRPQLQRLGVRPAGRFEYVFRWRRPGGQPARFDGEVRCELQRSGAPRALCTSSTIQAGRPTPPTRRI